MKFFLFGSIVFLSAVFVGLYLFLRSPVFGARLSNEQLAQLAKSPQFNITTNEFENRRPELFEQMRESSSMIDMLSEWFRRPSDTRPPGLMPEVKPNLDVFPSKDSDVQVIWLGHSTFLLSVSGKIILIDPVFSKSVAPVSFVARRFQAPPISLSELPPVDIVLLSHDHYDHLDMPSIRHFENTSTVFIAPLGVGAHLQRWGIAENRITEKDWWENHEIGDIELIAAPAQHFSGRDGINNNKTLWSSWIIRSDHSNLYFSGDSGYDTHFKIIGDRYGPFDLAFMEVGQYDVRWPTVHLFPEEAVVAASELRAERILPIHWGMFELAFHSWNEPVTRLEKALNGKQIQLVSPQLGETITLSDQIATTRWWNSLGSDLN